MRIKVFLVLDHENGDMNGTRSGRVGTGRSSLAFVVSFCFEGRPSFGN